MHTPTEPTPVPQWHNSEKCNFQNLTKCRGTCQKLGPCKQRNNSTLQAWPIQTTCSCSNRTQTMRKPKTRLVGAMFECHPTSSTNKNKNKQEKLAETNSLCNHLLVLTWHQHIRQNQKMFGVCQWSFKPNLVILQNCQPDATLPCLPTEPRQPNPHKQFVKVCAIWKMGHNKT